MSSSTILAILALIIPIAIEIYKAIENKKKNKQIIKKQAEEFLKKYNNNKDSHSSQLHLLPLCLMANEYNKTFNYRREIYNEFSLLPNEVQQEILRQRNINIFIKNKGNFYEKSLEALIKAIESYCPGKNIFHENDEYFKRSITEFGKEKIPEINCAIDEYWNTNYIPSTSKTFSFEIRIKHLLDYEKNNNPIEKLMHEKTNLGTPASSTSAIVISYLCCYIAIYVSNFSSELEKPDELNECNFVGELYMEDLFLKALLDIYVYLLGGTKQ